MTIEAQLTRIADALEKIAAKELPQVVIPALTGEAPAVASAVALGAQGGTPTGTPPAEQKPTQARGRAAKKDPPAAPQAPAPEAPKAPDVDPAFLLQSATTAKAQPKPEDVLAALQAAIARQTKTLGGAEAAHKAVRKAMTEAGGYDSLPEIVKNSADKFAAVIAAAEKLV